MKKSLVDILEETGDIPRHEFKVGAIVEVFEDVMTQHKHEGVAKIEKIYKVTDDVVDCGVRFYIKDSNKLEEEVVRRQVRRTL